jgi:hypothetical protein
MIQTSVMGQGLAMSNDTLKDQLDLIAVRMDTLVEMLVNCSDVIRNLIGEIDK